MNTISYLINGVIMARRPTDKQIIIRLDATMKSDLEFMAADRNRSVNKTILDLVERELRQFKKEYRERDLSLDLPLE